ncbi:hypothetical protein B0I27_10336 [Arcticibacter pallidicorallinus]|uniref:Uncharacterized protein n=1 Tax=Arcticibacter pallidicorallinus TaxID=1259464 RepID=A0A2T0U6M9_9SPHI|nr:hypothetical protein [Arcticibacter pallidicorallinus]PRY53571.1 hypothetical protein B0I27_10336 [Arcticibacter pallidicorallinus]
METHKVISNVSASAFNCNCCDASLNYIQVLNDELRIQEDYFECPKCGSKIESLLTEEEDVPAFFD